ncbi:hypothetical protein WJX81_002334 [Elliptochloris bilobata]|uniref:Enoyl-CoA hydratase n=1 Tax=Elliptochloris bilobata TaxID=381761 RepID=A0AAW1RWY6_9CHLO
MTLSRPAARNAIGRQLLKELGEALRLLNYERSTRCVVVRSSSPGVFSAGADLKERATMTQVEAADFVTLLRSSFSALEALPMPTVAVIDGFAIGGGAELALSCDLRVAGHGATFAFPETRLGIIPGAGGTQRLPRVVGRTRAKELVFTGRRIDASEAATYGLVDYVVEPGTSAEERGMVLARDIAQAGPIALRMAKAAINGGMETDLQTGLAMESACYAQVLPTQDRLEGLRAFAEKRVPVFTGM